MRIKRIYHEDNELIAFFKAIYGTYVYDYTWHTANERKCSITQGARMKAKGVKAGVPDVFVAIPTKLYHGLFLEFKIGKNKLTPLQKKWHARLVVKDYAFFVCYSHEEALSIVHNYLDGKAIPCV